MSGLFHYSCCYENLSTMNNNNKKKGNGQNSRKNTQDLHINNLHIPLISFISFIYEY